MEVNKDDYLYGRCHIFALALHEIFQYPIEFFWDTAAMFDDGVEREALIHAFCLNYDGQCIDASGITTKEAIEDDYDWNEPLYRKISIEELSSLMETGFLEPPEMDELDMLTKYIQEHIQLYKKERGTE